MELDIWSGDFDLPSVDTQCLQIMAYSRFCSAPLKINPTNNPWKSFSGSLPIFKHDSKVKLYKFNDIVNYLKIQNYNPDFDLTKRNLNDIQAYSMMLSDKLAPAILLLWWFNEQNYLNLTRPWYAKKIPFPGNYFIPGRYRSEAENYMINRYNDLEEIEIEKIIIDQAIKCLTALSDKLANQDYFFGVKPSSLDAIVFGYLAPLIKVPFPSYSSIRTHLYAYSNLISFVDRILKTFFTVKGTVLTEVEEEPASKVDEDSEFKNKWRGIVVSSFVAVSAMFLYALSSGIVQLDLGRDEEDDDKKIFSRLKNAKR